MTNYLGSLTIHLSAHSTANGYLLGLIADAAREVFDGWDITVTNDRTAHRIFTGQHRDVLLVIGGENANGSLCRRLTACHRVKAIWYFEDPYELPVNKVTALSYDLVFTNDASSVSAYPDGASNLLLAAPPAAEFPPLNDRPYAFNFVATGWPNRLNVYAALRDHEAIQPLRSFVRMATNPYIDRFFQETGIAPGVPIGFSEFMHVNRLSKVALTVNRAFSGHENNAENADTPGPRFFEVAQTGAVQLVDTVTSSSLERIGFVKDKDFLSFNSFENAATTLADAISDSSRLSNISKSCQRKVRLAHQYKHRLSVIRESAEEKLKSTPLTPQVKASKHSRPKILVLAHSSLFKGSVAGAEVYLQSIIDAVRDRYHLFILTPKAVTSGMIDAYELFDADDGNLLRTIKLASQHNYETLTNLEIEKIVIKLVSDLDARHIIVNHMIGFTAGLTESLNKLGINYTYVAHDYFVLCDEFNLLDYQGFDCGIDRFDYDLCRICIYKRRNFQDHTAYLRRSIMRNIPAMAYTTVVNLHSVGQIFGRVLSIAPEKFTVIEPAPVIDPFISQVWRERTQKRAKTPRKIAILGNVMRNKGSARIPRIADLLAPHNITLVIIGKHDLQDATLRKHNLEYGGQYSFSDVTKMPSIFFDCSAALFLSQWRETYCITLEEAAQAGLPAVVTRSETLEERASSWSLVKTAETDEDIVEAILTLMNVDLCNERKDSPSVRRSTFEQAWNDLIDQATAKTSYNLGEDPKLPHISRKRYADWRVTRQINAAVQHTDVATQHTDNAFIVPTGRQHAVQLSRAFRNEMRANGIVSALQKSISYVRAKVNAR